MKSVQNDTGHASAKMVVDVYAHRNQPAIKKLSETVQNDFYGEQLVKSENDKVANTPADTNVSDDSEVKALTMLLEKLKKKDPQLHKEVLNAVLSKEDTVSGC